MPRKSVLIVDGDSDFLAWAEKSLTNADTRVLGAPNAEAALVAVQKEKPDLVVAEVVIEPFNGVELLRRIRRQDPGATVVLTTGFPPADIVIESMKLGAYDVLKKESLPFNLKTLIHTALQEREEIEITAAQESTELSLEDYRQSIIGRSEEMQDVFKLIGRVAPTSTPVLVTGESGCGKELVARALHQFSLRAKNEYVAINCAAIPENLLESELFGHEKGSFTGAVAQRIGRFEQCDGGTLFLDEVGDIPLPVQSKLLRILQDGGYSRVGGNDTRRTDVRILTATNRDLESEVAENRFREDLYYRLNVVRIHLPPLRDRPEDIRLLADFFLQKMTAGHPRAPRLRLSQDAVARLESYSWPGNVRELENTLQRAAALSTTNAILPKDLPLGKSPPMRAGYTAAESAASTGDEASPAGLDSAFRTIFEAAGQQPKGWLKQELARQAVAFAEDDPAEAAKLLGITPAALKKHLGES